MNDVPGHYITLLNILAATTSPYI